MPETIRIEPSSEAPPALVAKAKEMVGRVLDGRYRLDSLVAARPWGAVYRAEHLKLAVWTALKVVRADALSGDVARIERQAIAGAQVRHPNLVAVTDAGQLTDGARYLAMDLVHGSTLGEVLQAGPLPAARALAIARQLLAALHALHEVGIVHTSIDPESVILSGAAGDVVKLIGFGRARLDPERIAVFKSHVVTDAARRAVLLEQLPPATSSYQAPEAVAGGDVDARADLYSLGAVLYEMLSGQPPFGRDDAAHPFAALRPAPPPLSERAPGKAVGAPLSAVVERLLAHDRNARYPNASSVLAALGQLDVPEHAASKPSVPPRAEAKRSVPPPDGPQLLGRAGLRGRGSFGDRVMDGVRDMGLAARRLGASLGSAMDRAGLPRWALAATAAGLVGLIAVVWVVAARPIEATEDAAMPISSGTTPSAAKRGNDIEVAPASEGSAAASAAPVTREVGGKDGAAWRKQLLAAADGQDWGRAGKAVEALIELGEDGFREGKVVGAVMSTAVALEMVGGKPADAIYEGLRSRLGTRGIEILFEIARTKGGTKGAKRARAIVDDPEVIARQPPPLRIAIELFRTPCEGKAALFQRAAEEGDERSLTSLRVLKETECPRRQPNAPCCFEDNKELANAISRLRERLGKPVRPVEDD